MLFKKIFNKFLKIIKPKLPIPGEIWYLKSDDKSPWPESNTSCTITILDCKDGWVRYQINPKGIFFDDERMGISSFLYCYKYIEKIIYHH